MSIETTKLLMESVIVFVPVIQIAAVALVVFGWCLLTVAIVCAARRTAQVTDAVGNENAAPRVSVADVAGVAVHTLAC